MFGPAQSGAEHHRRWLRTDDPLAEVDSLRDVSRSAERTVGVGLQPLLLDFLMLVRSARAAAAVGGSIAAALGAAPDEVANRVQAMARADMLRITRGIGNGDDALVEPTARHAAALEQFEEFLAGAFVSRVTLRRALLVNRISDAALAACVQRIFDRFFDLGWLYLHNWAGTCPMMATLVAEALRVDGHPSQVMLGSFDAVLDSKTFGMGRQGVSGPGRLDGHVLCVADGRAVVTASSSRVSSRRILRERRRFAKAVRPTRSCSTKSTTGSAAVCGAR
ncbi:hypothetical protein [Accumulibacter sp.]|uniref:Uncharacterized protein n=1 Tax=Accumulibacter regalis TaxID=522306 RepID=C7RU43_ACCRE|nr:hypothetical protein [Accumulibacter sp.]MBN8496152.1 hypothetical protein [Accumulibacter sp.]MBO3716178.1 hypothetical protein [Accumulibacter sp.]